MTLRPAVFLDRDGTINVEVNYLYRLEDLQTIAGVPEAISRLNRAGRFVVVVTNQAGIARGFYGVEEMHALHEHLNAVLKQHDAHVDAWLFCPHHPDFTGPCACRKPAPGMLLEAAVRYDLDLGQSWLVGDSAGDLGAGTAAGSRTILVRTGYGAAVESLIETGEVERPSVVVDALPQAVDHILRTELERL
ncbi:MAG: D-glycero-beta-D-manno-heptose-1,7-bisphosphate 7-phosphatase [uncultured Chloroflexia bacterium]|uniref:D,D-heptose 1,7-bisphosphate phosphatase n=1 Tax=uncultured Chloroflexia bacterium TaxID=1672391 RepID=A0A6J4MJ90_9CHLR|nr:MAG: D-glycero-beta-D-manno-heptose-1,7-bisphosphate 7-phosphatase [uncultured Chloroflexia bacterium]